MKTRLKDMVIDEVSLVKRGANQMAHIMLYKSAEGVKTINLIDRAKQIWKALSFDEVLDSKEANSDWWEITSAFETSVKSIMMDKDADQSEMLMDTCEQFVRAAKKIVPRMVEPVYLSAEGVVTAVEAITEDVAKAGKVISSATMKRLEAVMTAIKEIMGQMTQGDTNDGEDKKLSGKGLPPVDDKMKKSQGDDEIMKFEDILKSLTPEQQTAIQKAIDDAVAGAIAKTAPVDVAAITKSIEDKFAADIKKQSEENAELKKSLDAEKDIRITKEFNDKAASYKNIAVDGKVLKQVAAASPEAYAEMLKTLDAAEASMGQNNLLLKEIGGGPETTSDHDAKVEKLAKEYRTVDPKMSQEAAVAKVYDEHPELYNEYERERQ